MAFLPDTFMDASLPSYIIYRDTKPGQAYDSTAPLIFAPPKDSDELFDALRFKFPHVKTHSERMRDAVIEFLLDEQQTELLLTDTSQTLPSESTSTSPWQQSWRSMSSCASQASAFSTPETLALATPTFGNSPSPHLPELVRQTSSATANEPRTPHLEQMTSVFSLSTTSQPKTRTRRKMTEAEKVEYRKRRIVKACDKCAKRKRKCDHNHPEMESLTSKVQKKPAKREILAAHAIPSHTSFGSDMLVCNDAAASDNQLLGEFCHLFDDFPTDPTLNELATSGGFVDVVATADDQYWATQPQWPWTIDTYTPYVHPANLDDFLKQPDASGQRPEPSRATRDIWHDTRQPHGDITNASNDVPPTGTLLHGEVPSTIALHSRASDAIVSLEQNARTAPDASSLRPEGSSSERATNRDPSVSRHVADGTSLLRKEGPSAELFMLRRRIPSGSRTSIMQTIASGPLNTEQLQMSRANGGAYPRLELNTHSGAGNDTINSALSVDSATAGHSIQTDPRSSVSASASKASSNGSNETFASLATTPHEDRLSDHVRYRDHHGRPQALHEERLSDHVRYRDHHGRPQAPQQERLRDHLAVHDHLGRPMQEGGYRNVDYTNVFAIVGGVLLLALALLLLASRPDLFPLLLALVVPAAKPSRSFGSWCQNGLAIVQCTTRNSSWLPLAVGTEARWRTCAVADHNARFETAPRERDGKLIARV